MAAGLTHFYQWNGATLTIGGMAADLDWAYPGVLEALREDSPAVPSWPLAPGKYFGPITGPDVSHGGFYLREQPWVRMIQQALIRKRFVPGITDPSSGWADGIYQEPILQAVQRFQASAPHKQTGNVGPGDWDPHTALTNQPSGRLMPAPRFASTPCDVSGWTGPSTTATRGPAIEPGGHRSRFGGRRGRGRIHFAHRITAQREMIKISGINLSRTEMGTRAHPAPERGRHSAAPIKRSARNDFLLVRNQVTLGYPASGHVYPEVGVPGCLSWLVSQVKSRAVCDPRRDPATPRHGGRSLADPHRNPTDETAHSGTLVMRVKGTKIAGQQR